MPTHILFALWSRTEALLEYHSDHVHHYLDSFHLLGCCSSHGMGCLWLWTHEDLLHSGLQPWGQVACHEWMLCFHKCENNTLLCQHFDSTVITLTLYTSWHFHSYLSPADRRTLISYDCHLIYIKLLFRQCAQSRAVRGLIASLPTTACKDPLNTSFNLILFPFLSGTNRDYVTYMLALVLLYLLFPAFTMWSCYDSISKHFKKVHQHRVN